MRFLCQILFVILLCGCAFKETNLSFPKQDLAQFVDNKALDFNKTKELKKSYLLKFFSPFNAKNAHTKESLAWGLNAAFLNYGFGENLLPYTKDEILALQNEANLDSYPSALQKGIIIRNTNLRVLPTNKPRFSDINKAGSAYPFDTWQNSSIYFGTPVLITHYSKSKEWAFVESGFVSGWVRVVDVGILKQKSIDKLLNAQDFVVFVKNKIPLFSINGIFLESLPIGAILPILGSSRDSYEVLSFIRDSNGFAKEVRGVVSVDLAEKFPMPFSSVAVATLAQNLIGEKYGWGGAYGNRDCSMLLRDIFGNFGFYLPRNSQAQIKGTNKDSNYLELLGKNAEQKKQAIKEFGIPFATLLGMKGHIALYLGAKDDKIFILHDVWGLKTLQNETQEGRKIIGQIAITDIEIGKNVKDIVQENLIIERVYGARNLFFKEALYE